MRRSPTKFALEPLEPRRFLSIGDILPTGATETGIPVKLATAISFPQGSDTVQFGNGGLERLTSTGSVDTTFGNDGVTTFSFEPQAVTATADGQILVMGPNGTHIDIVRLSSSGVVDTTFGSDGLLTVPLTANTTYSLGAITTDSAGHILLATLGQGSLGAGNAIYTQLVRLQSDGAIDTSYGSNGYATINNTVFASFTPLSDGSIVENAELAYSGENEINFITASGTVTPNLLGSAGEDESYSAVPDLSGGFYLTEPVGYGYVRVLHYHGAVAENSTPFLELLPFCSHSEPVIYDIAAEPDGKLLYAYEVRFDPDIRALAFAQLNADGSLDSTFAPLGFVIPALNYIDFEQPSNLTILSNGDWRLDGLSGNGVFERAFFQGVDHPAINPSVAAVTMAAPRIGSKYAYVTVTYKPGSAPLDRHSVTGTSLIVSSAYISGAAELVSTTPDGPDLKATYVFRIDKHGLSSVDDGVFSFIALNDAVSDALASGSGGGLIGQDYVYVPKGRTGTATITPEPVT